MIYKLGDDLGAYLGSQNPIELPPKARPQRKRLESAKVAAAKAYETKMPIVVTQGETTYMNVAEILAAPPPCPPKKSARILPLPPKEAIVRPFNLGFRYLLSKVPLPELIFKGV